MPQNSICISILVIFSFSTNCRQGLHELCTCAIRCKFCLPDSYYLASMIGILRLLPGGTWPNTLHHDVGLGMRPNVQMRACRGATGTEWYGGCAGAVVLGCGRSVPLKTAVESSPTPQRLGSKSSSTHPEQTPWLSSPGFCKSILRSVVRTCQNTIAVLVAVCGLRL